MTPEPSSTWVAVSVRGALRAEASTESAWQAVARNLAWMSRPDLILVTDDGDIVIVGRWHDRQSHVTLDDFCVAYHNIATIDGAGAPYVSIDLPTQRSGLFQTRPLRLPVRYGGERFIDTAMARTFFDVDFLFKLLSTGLVPLPIEGMPNEWQLSLHQAKMDKATAGITTAYFYPATVNVFRGERAAAVRQVRVGVRSPGQDHVIEAILQDDWPTPSQAEAAARDVEDGASPLAVFGALIVRNYEAFAAHYPAFARYPGLLRLLALAKQLENMPVDNKVAADIQKRNIQVVTSPRSIPGVARTRSGLIIRLRTRGGIPAPRIISQGTVPSELREHVLGFRPDPDEIVCWLVPITDANADVIRNLNADTQRLLAFVTDRAPRPSEQGDLNYEIDAAGHITRWAVGEVEGGDDAPQPGFHDPPDWRPRRSAGRHMIELSGNLVLGIDGGVQAHPVRPDQLFQSIDPPSDIFAATYNVRAAAVFDDRLELAIEAPVRYKFFDGPHESNLPGLRGLGHAAGLANVRIGAQYLLYDGGWDAPSVILQSSIDTPLTTEFFRAEERDTIGSPIGIDGWNAYLGGRVVTPVTDALRVSGTLLYNFADFETDMTPRRTERNYILSAGADLTLQGIGLRIGTEGSYIMRDRGRNVPTFEVYLEPAVASDELVLRIQRTSFGFYFLESGSYFFYTMSLSPRALGFQLRHWFPAAFD